MTHLLPSVGDRIRLLEMPNDPCPIEPGSLGTILYVSAGPGQIGVKWDSGRTLHLVIGVDVFEVVATHRVVLIEDCAYTRYELLIEATDPDQAAGIAREMVTDGRAGAPRMEHRDDALPYVTDVINHEGEECAFSEEHGHDGVMVPDLLKARDTCADVIESIDDFAVACGRAQHTDTGEAWDLLNRIRTALFEALPKDMQQEATAYLHERATTAEREDAIEADHAQHAMTVSA
ncbi:hypothetical protein ABID82_005031 [Methylobacterium sp. PvP062]|uniref:DUF4314 domain-containing protein n=1 Tax=Methylobacterium radiotolerans TaxID=31998 RepID=A0ABV2NTX7_9HYPH|nr:MULTISPECIES: DUF4314 domain-containing protein [unclassified Methylobacterium]MBP2498345.1 hypothetical protein [Methylobacterium sp. PvP105]MBP2505729.1 hypothetical protein [Methylobacterium sp. PvP109]